MKEHIIQLDIAKEMAMLERNEQGKRVRRYFIDVEKRYKEGKRSGPTCIEDVLIQSLQEMKDIRAKVDKQSEAIHTVKEAMTAPAIEEPFGTWVARKIESIANSPDFNANPFRGGIQSLTALLIPLFTSAFRHAETLSAAMEARCYHGGVGTTRLEPLRLTWRDAVGTAALLLMIAAVIATNYIPLSF